MLTKANSIYINLPVKNLNKTRDFWTALGFSFNEKFCDNNAICLILNEGIIYVMLLKNEFFQTFTDRTVSDSSTTQVIIAIDVESREKVDETVKLALENGASRFKEPADHGWVYYDSFADPDGHQWEVMFADESQIPQQ